MQNKKTSKESKSIAICSNFNDLIGYLNEKDLKDNYTIKEKLGIKYLMFDNIDKTKKENVISLLSVKYDVKNSFEIKEKSDNSMYAIFILGDSHPYKYLGTTQLNKYFIDIMKINENNWISICVESKDYELYKKKAIKTSMMNFYVYCGEDVELIQMNFNKIVPLYNFDSDWANIYGDKNATIEQLEKGGKYIEERIIERLEWNKEDLIKRFNEEYNKEDTTKEAEVETKPENQMEDLDRIHKLIKESEKAIGETADMEKLQEISDELDTIIKRVYKTEINNEYDIDKALFDKEDKFYKLIRKIPTQTIEETERSEEDEETEESEEAEETEKNQSIKKTSKKKQIKEITKTEQNVEDNIIETDKYIITIEKTDEYNVTIVGKEKYKVKEKTYKTFGGVRNFLRKCNTNENAIQYLQSKVK